MPLSNGVLGYGVGVAASALVTAGSVVGAGAGSAPESGAGSLPVIGVVSAGVVSAGAVPPELADGGEEGGATAWMHSPLTLTTCPPFSFKQ